MSLTEEIAVPPAAEGREESSRLRGVALFLRRERHRLLFIAVICFLLAVFIEHPLVTTALDQHGGKSNVLNWELPIKLLLELANAFFIAWIVANGIERESKSRDRRAADILRKQIADDVFKAVLELSHSKNYSKKVFDVALRAELVREFIEVTYTIDSMTSILSHELGVRQDRFVILTSRSRYTFRNISGRKKPFPLSYAYAIRSGKLKSFNKVTKLNIKSDKFDRKYSEIEIAQMTSDRDSFYSVCKYQVELEPGGSVDIFIENRMIKERSDNEIWGSFYPTEKVRLMANSNVPGLIIGVRALTASDAVQVYINPEKSAGEWHIDEPMLPHDSVVLWWRTEEDDSGSESDGVSVHSAEEMIDRPGG